MSKSIEPDKCACGSMPEIKEETNYYGGGRYKGMDKSVSWSAVCMGKRCSQRAMKYRDIFRTREEVTKAWNEKVREDKARRAAPDKLLYDFEHSDDKVKIALARILRVVESEVTT